MSVCIVAAEFLQLDVIEDDFFTTCADSDESIQAAALC